MADVHLQWWFFNLNESLCIIMSEVHERASDTQPNYSSSQFKKTVRDYKKMY